MSSAFLIAFALWGGSCFAILRFFAVATAGESETEGYFGGRRAHLTLVRSSRSAS
jgi:hypothetical protein